MAHVISKLFGFTKGNDRCAESAPAAIYGNEWTLEQKQTGSGVNVYRNGELVAEMFGPADYIAKGFKALKAGGTIDASFEQRHGLEVYLPDGSSPSN